MKAFDYVITDEVGIHARPAGLLAKEAKKHASKITITHGEKTADATKLMALLALGVKQGTQITVSVEGGDEDATVELIRTFFAENL